MRAELRKCKGALIFGHATVTFWPRVFSPATGSELASSCDPPVARMRDFGLATLDASGPDSKDKR
jgi:hypothetical protein